MTPLQPAIADAPIRKLQTWRTATTILACSLASMTIAVVVMAWQVTRLTRERDRDRQPTMRATHSGLYSAESRMPLGHTSVEDIRRGMEHDCAVLAEMRRTATGFYAP